MVSEMTNVDRVLIMYVIRSPLCCRFSESWTAGSAALESRRPALAPWFLGHALSLSARRQHYPIFNTQHRHASHSSLRPAYTELYRASILLSGPGLFSPPAKIRASITRVQLIRSPGETANSELPSSGPPPHPLGDPWSLYAAFP